MEMLSSASDRAKLFPENFLRTLILMTLDFSLTVFYYRTNLKVHVSVTPKIIKKVITNHDSQKASGLYCIPVELFKNPQPEDSFILVELFNMYQK